jgi:hypothetical protein
MVIAIKMIADGEESYPEMRKARRSPASLQFIAEQTRRNFSIKVNPRLGV